MGFVAEWILILSVVLAIATQVLVPAYNNRQLFPLFRRESKLKTKLVELEQEGFEQQLSHAVAEKEATIHPVVEVKQDTPQ